MTADLHLLGHLKRLIAALGVGLVSVLPLAVTACSTIVVIALSTGADPRTALTDAPAAPAVLDELVEWETDAAGLLRSVEPETRTAVGTAWLGALSSIEPGSDVSLVETWYSGSALTSARAARTAESLTAGPRWTRHRAHVHFYSLDGRIMGLVVESVGTVDVGGTDIGVADRTEAVLVLQDGNWRVDALAVRARS